MAESTFDTSIVREVDSTLEFKRDLYPEATTCWTVLVEQDGVSLVLKVRRKSHNMWDQRYFYYEISALQRAAEYELQGVTRLRKVYETDQFQALLKEYADGTPGNRIDQENLMLDPDFVARLDRLYLKLHLAGIAKVCFEPRKVVIAENRELTLVDLSSCVINTEVGILLFSQAMREDSRYITHLEQEIRRRTTGHQSLFDRILHRA